jgi:hypothetical protein
MGIKAGTPCCGCRIVIWRIAWTKMHNYYGTNPSAEFTVVGTADGFFHGNANRWLELENTGGTNWTLAIYHNGIGRDSRAFSHNFGTTPVVDNLFEWEVGEPVRQMITIMRVSDARPDDFWWLPNRSVVSLIRIPDLFTATPVSLAETTDANYHYFGTIARIPKARTQDNEITIRAPWQVSTPPNYQAFGPIESPFFVPNHSGVGGVGFVYDEDDPVIVEKISYSLLNREVTSHNLEGNISWTGTTPNGFQFVFGNRAYPGFFPLQAEIGVDTPLFDASGVLAAMNAFGASAVNTWQYALVSLWWNHIYIHLEASFTGGSPGTFYRAAFPISSDGTFSGELLWRRSFSPTDVLIPVSGTVERQSFPERFWPWPGEQLFSTFNSPKIILPEFFENQQEIETPFNWALKRGASGAGVAGRCLFVPRYVAPIGNGPGLASHAVSIESGSLPTGMSWFETQFNTFTRIATSGVPTVNQSGYVRFQISIERQAFLPPNGSGARITLPERYKSKRYYWKVGTGSIFLHYPDWYHHGTDPPEQGYDWRFEHGEDISLAATVDAGTAPYTFSLENGDLPPGCSLNASTGLISATSPASYPSENGNTQIKVTDDTAATALSINFQWQYFGVDFEIEYPSPFTNTATPPGGGFDWRIDGNTMVLTPLSISATITGGTAPYTCSVHSGTLPPYASLNTATGEIYTTGISPLDPSTTGSVVIKCVDDNAVEIFSTTYNWEYIG